MNAPRITDHHLPAGTGSLFARAWQGRDGCAPPIVLLHDSLGCVELWRGFPATLAVACGRTVIAYDRLGFGRSSPRSGALPRSFIADEADHGFAAVRAHFGLERFVLFGHSVGGGMAVHCAARYPEACAALVTEAAQAFVEDRTRAGLLEASSNSAGRAAWSALPVTTATRRSGSCMHGWIPGWRQALRTGRWMRCCRG